MFFIVLPLVLSDDEKHPLTLPTPVAKVNPLIPPGCKLPVIFGNPAAKVEFKFPFAPHIVLSLKSGKLKVVEPSPSPKLVPIFANNSE